MGDRTWPNLLNLLLRGEELSTADTAWAMDEIMTGSATAAQIAGFAVALRAKGETPTELGGLVQAMLGRSVPVVLSDDLRDTALDVVGTGGDLAHTVNISTMTALVVAGAGVRVVKHGNRAASSLCGTADLLEYLGIPWTSARSRSPAASRRPASGSASRPGSTPGCGTPVRSAVRWACPPSSTSSAR